jgi:hypothetical protein
MVGIEFLRNLSPGFVLEHVNDDGFDEDDRRNLTRNKVTLFKFSLYKVIVSRFYFMEADNPHEKE